MSVQIFSFLACLEVARLFRLARLARLVWGGVVGWGGVEHVAAVSNLDPS